MNQYFENWMIIERRSFCKFANTYLCFGIWKLDSLSLLLQPLSNLRLCYTLHKQTNQYGQNKAKAAADALKYNFSLCFKSFLLTQPLTSNIFEVKGAPSSNEGYLGKEVVFLEMERGLNHESRASEEDALSTPPPKLGCKYFIEIESSKYFTEIMVRVMKMC